MPPLKRSISSRYFSALSLEGTSELRLDLGKVSVTTFGTTMEFLFTFGLDGPVL